MKYEVALARARNMRKNPTKAESYMWERVRKRRLSGFKFYRQYIVEHAGEEYYKAYYIVDFYCHTKKLVVELDGGIHQEAIEKQYDLERDAKLHSMGFQTLRIKNEMIFTSWHDVESMILARLR